MEQIAQVISQIGKVTQSTAAPAEQSAAAGAELVSQSDTMRESLDRFNRLVMGKNG